MFNKRYALALAVLIALSCDNAMPGKSYSSVFSKTPVVQTLTVQDGYEISVYASGLDGARFMALSPEGVPYVTLTGNGRIAALPDYNKDGLSDKTVIASEGLDSPHGIEFYGGFLYVANTGSVVRFKYDKVTLMLSEKTVIVDSLPTEGGGHFTRTIKFGKDGMMYVSVGSSCNLCEEKDRRRAAVLRFTPEGRVEIFAEGLRNSVGLEFNPITGELWGTDNGRDWLGDDVPPDEINAISKGRHYGWPYCFGKRMVDPEFNKRDFCSSTEPPAVEIQAHSAPLGLEFIDGMLLVALHGSWNRSEPTGYKIISVPLSGGKPAGRYKDFISGWLRNGKVRGRPVDIMDIGDGAMLISDDYSGLIYRVASVGQ